MLRLLKLLQKIVKKSASDSASAASSSAESALESKTLAAASANSASASKTSAESSAESAASSATTATREADRAQDIADSLEGLAGITGIATTDEAIAGVVDNKAMTPLKTKEAIESLVPMQRLIDLIYPVGSIYMSVNSTSPADLLAAPGTQCQQDVSCWRKANPNGAPLIQREVPAVKQPISSLPRRCLGINMMLSQTM